MLRELVFSRAGLREVDRRAGEEFGISVLVLMESAGRAVAERVLLHRKWKGRVLVICGAGNNGGDGLVCARWLWNAGVEVLVLLVAGREKFVGAAGVQLGIVDRMGMAVEVVSEGHAELRDWVVEGSGEDVIVDGIFGTGLSRAVEGLTAEVIRAVNGSGRWVVAIDIPSGMDADSGEVLGVAMEAKETVSFCGSKRGFLNERAGRFTGKVVVADIGVPRGLLEELAERS